MASGAIVWRKWTGRPRMAHRRRRKRSGIFMASIALRAGRDMRAGLALGGHAMATGATTGHRRGNQGVIEVCSSKSGVALMADIALRSRG